LGGGTVPEYHQGVPLALNMAPCETITIDFTGIASSNPDGAVSVNLFVKNSFGDDLAVMNFTCTGTCSASIPLEVPNAGIPMPGTRGAEGLPATFLVTTGFYNWFGWPYELQYSVVARRTPRPLYNQGGLHFTDAPLIQTGVTQYGSVHWRETGQVYKIHLEPGQMIFTRGQAKGTTTAANFKLTLFSPSQQPLVNLANVVAGDSFVQFPTAGTSPVTYINDTGAAGDFYVVASSVGSVTQDFSFEVATPRLTVSPSPVTRGDNVTLAVVDAPGLSVSNWSYRITDYGALATVSRTANSNSPTWTGQLVVSGTAAVTVGTGAYSQELSTAVAVQPRDWQPFQPQTPVKRDAGFVTNCHDIMAFTDPSVDPSQSEGIGAYKLCLAYLINGSEFAFVDGGSDPGPNQGVKWLLDIHDTTTIDWGMHKDVEDPTSAWSVANCGNFIPGPDNSCSAHTGGDGYVLAADFRDGVERHEIGTTNSHHWKYSQVMSIPELSIRLQAEPLVGPPAMNLAGFVANVKMALDSVRDAIKSQLTGYEPCGAQCDGTCSTFIGWFNYKRANGSYDVCIVRQPSGFTLFSPKGSMR